MSGGMEFVGESVRLLPTIFSLNSIGSKKVFMGLECTTLSEKKYIPIMSLLDLTLTGIGFNISQWSQLKEQRTKINSYSYGFDPNSRDKKIQGDKWTLKFTYSRHENALEFAEERQDVSSKTVIDFDHSSFHLHTDLFERLMEISQYIDHRFEYLTKTATLLPIVVETIVAHLFYRFLPMIDFRIKFRKDIVKMALNELENDDRFFDRLVKNVELRSNGSESNIGICKTEMKTFFYEIVITRTDGIVQMLNTRLGD
ncbi:hypothetical protein QAD02_020887 [Eretmocerus hayati]|uniref:Uncharacterized protein n=1 Tax=Eretmocerus hayati TaxID=131215 RepID=A0ACC2PP67_9HYME|nr:hypothetical protein QAD02_020887 [Eretmocerus hayati]